MNGCLRRQVVWPSRVGRSVALVALGERHAIREPACNVINVASCKSGQCAVGWAAPGV